MKVCFADNAAPSCATLVLVVHPGLGMQEVKVLRQALSAEHFQYVAQEAEAEVQQCRAEVRQLRAERSVPDGLRGVIASSLVDGKRGIAVKALSDIATERQDNALVKFRVYSYRSQERVAVEVQLKNTGTAPWTAAGAVLRGLKGEVLKPLALWQLGPITPPTAGVAPEEGRVVVEFMTTGTEVRGTYTLTLWDVDRLRTVTLSNVTFPQ